MGFPTLYLILITYMAFNVRAENTFVLFQQWNHLFVHSTTRQSISKNPIIPFLSLFKQKTLTHSPVSKLAGR